MKFTNKFNSNMLSPQSEKNQLLDTHQSNAPADPFSEYHMENQQMMSEEDQIREEILINFSIFDDEKPANKESLPAQASATPSSKSLPVVKAESDIQPRSELIVNLPIIPKAIVAESKSPKMNKELSLTKHKTNIINDSPIYSEESNIHTNTISHTVLPQNEELPHTLNTKVTIPLIKNFFDPSVTKPYEQPPQLDEERVKRIIQHSNLALKSANEEKRFAGYCSNFLSRVRLE